jgi:hypothetical protein
MSRKSRRAKENRRKESQRPVEGGVRCVEEFVRKVVAVK